MDIDMRFRQELRDQELPPCISLQGNAMLTQIATMLLKMHAPDITIASNGIEVRLVSMEQFACQFIAAFLEEQDPPAYPLLLHTISEEELERFAQKHGIPIIREPHDNVRRMLDDLAHAQPQTYLSLTRSAQRLLPNMQGLRGHRSK